MYKLMVSHNCGISYECHGEAEILEELHPKAEKFDEQGLRWVIEDENGRFEGVSSIHRNIVAHVAAIAAENSK